MPAQCLDELRTTRYAMLRSFRRDGTPVDTPIWFGFDGPTVVFRTKIGPKTRRLAAQPDVELTACDYRGRVRPGAPTITGHATILSDTDADAGNRMLHERYGWQWNIVPLINVPGVTNVNRDLRLRERLRRARYRAVWPGFVIVRIEPHA